MSYMWVFCKLVCPDIWYCWLSCMKNFFRILVAWRPTVQSIWVIWFIWVGLFVFSTITSQHLLLSLPALLVPIGGSVWLWWWLQRIDREYWQAVVVKFSVWLLLLLSLVELLARLSGFLVGFSLENLALVVQFFTTHQITALLLLFLPFVWSDFFNQTKKITLIPSWLVVSFTVVLGLTMNMIGMLIGLAQLAFLLMWKLNQIDRDKRVVGFGLLLFLGLMVGLKHWLFYSGVESWLCERKILTTQWCLDQDLGLRWQYWHQAWQVGSTYPWLGSGPGTFTLSAKPFVQFFGTDSPVVHNWFLSLVAESGWLAALSFSFVLVFIGWLLWQQRQSSWGQATWVGFMGLLVFALFWEVLHTEILWFGLLTCIGLALPFSNVDMGSISNSKRSPKKQLSKGTTRTKFILVGVVGFLVLLSTVSIDVSELDAKQEIIASDPWQGFLLNQLAEYRSQPLSVTVATAESYWQLVKQSHDAGWQTPTHQTSLLADEFYNLASRLYADGDYQASGEWMVRAYKIDALAVMRNQPFVSATAVTAEAIDFIRPLATIPAVGYGEQRTTYVEVFNQVVLLQTRELITQIETAINLTLQYEDGNGIGVEEYRDRLFLVKKNTLLLASLALKILPLESDRDVSMINELTALLIRLVEYESDQTSFHAARLYQLALALQPTSMQDKQWWFEQREIQQKDKQAVYHFLDVWVDWDTSIIGKNILSFRNLLTKGIEFAQSDSSQFRVRKYQEQLQQLNKL